MPKSCPNDLFDYTTTALDRGVACMRVYWNSELRIMEYELVDIKQDRKSIAFEEIKKQPFFN